MNWRWIFWFLAILSGLCLLLILALLPETARNIVGNGSIRTYGIHKPLISSLRQEKHGMLREPTRRPISFRLPNPLSCLRIIFHRDTALVLFPNAVFYMNYSCMQASLSPLLMDIYGLNALQVGLTYLPYGVGCGLASYAAGTSLRMIIHHPQYLRSVVVQRSQTLIVKREDNRLRLSEDRGGCGHHN